MGRVTGTACWSGGADLLVEQLQQPLAHPQVADKPEVAHDQSALLQGVEAPVHAGQQPLVCRQFLLSSLLQVGLHSAVRPHKTSDRSSYGLPQQSARIRSCWHSMLRPRASVPDKEASASEEELTSAARTRWW